MDEHLAYNVSNRHISIRILQTSSWFLHLNSGRSEITHILPIISPSFLPIRTHNDTNNNL